MSKNKKMTRKVSRRVWRRETPPTRAEYTEALENAFRLASNNFDTWFKAFGWKVKRQFETGKFTIKPPGAKYRFGRFYCPTKIVIPVPVTDDDDYTIGKLVYFVARIDYRQLASA